MSLKVYIYGSEVLRCKAHPIETITDEVKALAADMLERMYESNGVGLAAEQVGRTESICVIDVPVDAEKEEYRVFNAAAVSMPLVMINPSILNSEGKQRDPEGCLSFPEINAPITRADCITVTYMSLDGENHTITVKGLLARAVQHEVDHLNGVLLVDRMSQVQRAAVAGKLRRLKSQCI